MPKQDILEYLNRINHEMFLILKFVDVVFVPSLRNISMANRLPPVSEQLISEEDRL